MTSNPYMRKKQPELVRRALLDAATQIILTRGTAALTIQAVAEAAGVTKGGLFHHFASKQALIAALHKDLFDKLDAEIDAYMEQDTLERGRFTRAYVKALLSGEDFSGNSPWLALSGALAAEPLNALTWASWFEQRMERHRASDNSPMLEIVCYATDGAWFTFVGQAPDPKRLTALRERLIAMTYQE